MRPPASFSYVIIFGSISFESFATETAAALLTKKREAESRSAAFAIETSLLRSCCLLRYSRPRSNDK